MGTIFTAPSYSPRSKYTINFTAEFVVSFYFTNTEFTLNV